jgi:hypothetical protein
MQIVRHRHEMRIARRLAQSSSHRERRPATTALCCGHAERLERIFFVARFCRGLIVWCTLSCFTIQAVFAAPLTARPSPLVGPSGGGPPYVRVPTQFARPTRAIVSMYSLIALKKHVFPDGNSWT